MKHNRHSATIKFFIVVGLFAFGVTQTVFPEDFFIGLSTECDLTINQPLSENTSLTNALAIRQIEEMVSLQLIPRTFFRERIGFGYYPGQSPVILLGLEIPIYEKLSIYKTRRFGVYSLNDFRFDLCCPKQSTFETSIGMLFPIVSIGGLLTGIGIDTHNTLFIKVAYSTGGYVTRLP